MTTHNNLKKTSFDFRISQDHFRINDDIDNIKIKNILHNRKENLSLEKSLTKGKSKFFLKTNKSIDRKMFDKKIDFLKKDYTTNDPCRYPISSIILKKLPRIRIRKVELSTLAVKDTNKEVFKEKTISADFFQCNSPEEREKYYLEEDQTNKFNFTIKGYYNLKLNNTMNIQRKLKRNIQSNNITVNSSNNNFSQNLKSWMDKLEKIQSDFEYTLFNISNAISNSQKKYMENTLFMKNIFSIANSKETEASKNDSYIQYSAVPIQKKKKVLHYKILRQEALSNSEIGDNKIQKVLNRVNNIRTYQKDGSNLISDKENTKMCYTMKNNFPNII